jgi:hypothetical protein
MVIIMNAQLTLVTAARAGISEREQMDIALKLILSQGGIAAMQQIYDAIESHMAAGFALSRQGQNSLRRVINSRAVDRGLIHKYDPQNPGWQITNKGVEHIRSVTGERIGEVRISARALINAQVALNEIRTTLDVVQAIEQVSSPRHRIQALFGKSGLILTITTWETFVEDILKLSVFEKLDRISSPKEVQSIFNSVARSWYESIKRSEDNHLKPNEFVKWTGEGWKQLIRDKLQDDLDKLNTPNSKNIQDLTKKYLGEDITEKWSWPGMSAERTQNRLDELIGLRGELAHRMGDYFEFGLGIPKTRLEKAIDFFQKLVIATEKSVSELIQ